MNFALNFQEFIAALTPITESYMDWGDGQLPLRERLYFHQDLPPEGLITSARAVLFKGKKVMVIEDKKGERFIVPGGCLEPGETVSQALRRELYEETGWTVEETGVLGFFHYHHLGAEPTGYPYPYPDFCQAIFTAQATTFDFHWQQTDPYIEQVAFHPARQVQDWPLLPDQMALLQAALHKRDKVNKDERH